jgi:hypothetical protein
VLAGNDAVALSMRIGLEQEINKICSYMLLQEIDLAKERSWHFLAIYLSCAQSFVRGDTP